VYVENNSHAKMKRDLVDFMQKAGGY